MDMDRWVDGSMDGWMHGWLETWIVHTRDSYIKYARHCYIHTIHTIIHQIWLIHPICQVTSFPDLKPNTTTAILRGTMHTLRGTICGIDVAMDNTKAVVILTVAEDDTL